MGVSNDKCINVCTSSMNSAHLLDKPLHPVVPDAAEKPVFWGLSENSTPFLNAGSMQDQNCFKLSGWLKQKEDNIT